MKISKNSKILIVGLGLIGGSYAQGLSRLGFEVGAIDVNLNSINFALDNGYISHGRNDIDENYISEFDIIIFALYPHLIVDWIDKFQYMLKSGVILTDVTGVKSAIVYKIESLLRADAEYIGAHPMAGKEVYGIKNADCSIFNGANYIVTPTANSTENAISVCKNIGELLGFRNISLLSPQEHDEMIGFLSQLTHCIAVSLMTCKESEHIVEYTGDSFRDLTRIAKINEDMWAELFFVNKAELLCQMDLFLEKFSAMKYYIENNDEKNLKEMMRLSTKRRSNFD